MKSIAFTIHKLTRVKDTKRLGLATRTITATSSDMSLCKLTPTGHREHWENSRRPDSQFGPLPLFLYILLL